MSPQLFINKNQYSNTNSILNGYMSKIILAIRNHNINIKDLADVLCDVIIICDNESETDPDKICEHIKNKIFGKFNIEIEI